MNASARRVPLRAPRFILLAACALLACGSCLLAGCSESESPSSASSSASDSGAIGMANPLIVYEDAAALKDATGLSVPVPTDAANISFYAIKDTGIAEALFTINDIEVSCRLKRTAEYEDISGVYETHWTETNEFADSDGAPQRVDIADRSVAVIQSYHAETGEMHCLVLQGDTVDRTSAMAIYDMVSRAAADAE